MKAVVITAFGGPENLELRDIPQPSIKHDEILVRVCATSVNPVDYKIRRAGSWAGIVPPAVTGYDVSGIVEKTGDCVSNFKAGDEVYYMAEISSRGGSYAQYHAVKYDLVEFKPGNLSHEESACLPLAGGTAWDSVISRTGIMAGETILIHGAGGVGIFAIQIARASGAKVIVNSSAQMLDEAKKLGADIAIDFRKDDFLPIVKEATSGEGVDAVFDTVGGDYLGKSIEVTKEYGRMAGIVGVEGSLKAAYRRNITIHFVFVRPARLKLTSLRNLAERGLLKPVIDSIMPLEKASKAHERIEKGGLKGKIVLQIP